MKLSKSILTAMIAGTAVTAVVSSCTKEEITKNEREQEKPSVGENQEETFIEFHDNCPTCGMG